MSSAKPGPALKLNLRRNLWEAEICREWGELALAEAGKRPDAERCFHEAIKVAGSQNAKLLQLRAAVALARLWAEQGEQAKAQHLLDPLYGWFTEGFDTVDLKDAKALLDGLS